MRSLTLQSMFSTSLSTISFSTLWVSSICFHDIRLQCISIRRVYPGVAVGEAVCCHHVCLNWPVCESFHPVSCLSLPVLRVSSFPSLSDCCSCGAETPAVTMLEGQPASFPCQKNKTRGLKINSSLNKFVKAASKGVQHLLWHSCQFDVTLTMWCITWQIVCMSVEEEGVAFVSRLIDRWVMAHWCTNHNANQWEGSCLELKRVCMKSKSKKKKKRDEEKQRYKKVEE